MNTTPIKEKTECTLRSTDNWCFTHAAYYPRHKIGCNCHICHEAQGASYIECKECWKPDQQPKSLRGINKMRGIDILNLKPHFDEKPVESNWEKDFDIYAPFMNAGTLRNIKNDVRITLASERERLVKKICDDFLQLADALTESGDGIYFSDIDDKAEQIKKELLQAEE